MSGSRYSLLFLKRYREYGVMELVYFACIWMAASFVNSISGMGAGMLAVPCLLLFMDVQLIVPVICTLGIFLSAGLAIQYHNKFQLNDIVFVLICAVPGIFIGTYALKILSSHVIEIIMAVFLISYVIWNIVQPQKVRGKDSILIGGSCGFLAGFFSATTTFSGPPLAVYTLYTGWKPEKVLGVLGCSFVIINAVSCMSQYFAGLYTSEILGYLLVGVPASIAGMRLAAPFVKYISQKLFRNIVLIIIGFAGIMCLMRVITYYF